MSAKKGDVFDSLRIRLLDHSGLVNSTTANYYIMALRDQYGQDESTDAKRTNWVRKGLSKVENYDLAYELLHNFPHNELDELFEYCPFPLAYVLKYGSEYELIIRLFMDLSSNSGEVSLREFVKQLTTRSNVTSSVESAMKEVLKIMNVKYWPTLKIKEFFRKMEMYPNHSDSNMEFIHSILVKTEESLTMSREIKTRLSMDGSGLSNQSLRNTGNSMVLNGGQGGWDRKGTTASSVDKLSSRRFSLLSNEAFVIEGSDNESTASLVENPTKSAIRTLSHSQVLMRLLTFGTAVGFEGLPDGGF